MRANDDRGGAKSGLLLWLLGAPLLVVLLGFAFC
jgi:hypothetical protein